MIRDVIGFGCCDANGRYLRNRRSNRLRRVQFTRLLFRIAHVVVVRTGKFSRFAKNPKTFYRSVRRRLVRSAAERILSTDGPGRRKQKSIRRRRASLAGPKSQTAVAAASARGSARNRAAAAVSFVVSLTATSRPPGERDII